MSVKILIILNSILIPCFLGHDLEIPSHIFGKNNRTRDKSSLEQSNNEDAEIENRIMGGENTTIKEFPWMAGVYIILKQNDYFFTGAASIITNRHLLTVAHVVVDSKNVPRPIVVLMGSELKYKGEVFKVQKVYVQPEYLTQGVKLDIGIIQLKVKISFTDVMRPIPLPGVNDVLKSYEGQVLTATGWGYTSNNYNETDILKKVNIPVLAQEVCKPPTKRLICGGDLKGNTVCQGDSGGPLMALKDGKYTIVGLACYNKGTSKTPCGFESTPAYFTKVASYLKWINRITTQ